VQVEEDVMSLYDSPLTRAANLADAAELFAETLSAKSGSEDQRHGMRAM
jgi:hypothetical protein